MEFDINNRYLVCYGDNSVNLIPLIPSDCHPDNRNAQIESQNSIYIDQDRFERIIDMQMASDPGDTYKLYVACKVAKQK